MTAFSTERPGGRTSHDTSRESDDVKLGELLKRARTGLGLTLEQISNETRIPRRHLEALEQDDLAAVPGEFYRRAETRAYARAVNLDQDLALMALDRVEAQLESPRSQESRPSRKGVLIAIGVVVAAAVLGRAMVGREPAQTDRRLPGATDNPGGSPPPPLEAQPSGDVLAASPSAQTDRVAPATSANVPPAPTENREAGAPGQHPEAPGPDPVAQSRDPEETEDQAGARTALGGVTELVVETDPPGARVTVNGIGWGTAPVTIRHLPPGEKRIRVSKEGYAAEERVVLLPQGRVRTLNIQLSSTP